MNLYVRMNFMPMTPLRTKVTTGYQIRPRRAHSLRDRRTLRGFLVTSWASAWCALATHVGADGGEDAREAAHRERCNRALLDVAHRAARGDDRGVDEACLSVLRGMVWQTHRECRRRSGQQWRASWYCLRLLRCWKESGKDLLKHDLCTSVRSPWALSTRASITESPGSWAASGARSPNAGANHSHAPVLRVRLHSGIISSAFSFARDIGVQVCMTRDVQVATSPIECVDTSPSSPSDEIVKMAPSAFLKK